MIQIYKIKYKIRKLLLKIKSRFFYKYLFNGFGNNSFIDSPLRIQNPENIQIGNNVRILYKSFLSANSYNKKKEVIISIGDNTYIGNFSHIIGTKNISIENNVLIADKVYITDNFHEFMDISVPIKEQGIRPLNGVFIGDGTWIGENACILGTKIGKNCVIASNAVVTKNVPDYSIVAGIPAKIIKRYNHNTQRWEKC